METFKNACSKELGLTLNNKKRVFLVLLNDIPRDKWPSICQGAKEYVMYEKASPTDNFGAPINYRSPKFANNIAVIRADLFSFMNEINYTLNARKVFIAKVCKKLENRRNTIVKALTADKIDIISDVPPPPNDPELYDQKVKDSLKSSILSIHLLNKMGDPYYPDDSKPQLSYVQRCAEIVLNEKTNHLIFISEENKSSSEEINTDYNKFCENIYNDSISDSIEPYFDIADIIPKIIEKYKKLIKPSKEIKRSIFLDYHKVDAQYVETINNILFNNNIRVFLSSSDSNNIDLITDFEQKLEEVFGYIAIYGDVNKDWVENRLREVKKFRGKDKGNIPVYGIYYTPGNKGYSNNYGTDPDQITIDDSPNTKITPTVLDSFIYQFNRLFINATLGRN